MSEDRPPEDAAAKPASTPPAPAPKSPPKPPPKPAPKPPVVRVAPQDVAMLQAYWPALFSVEAQFEPQGALPSADADLDALAAMTIPGPAGQTWADRHRSLPRHFRALEPEFGGATRLAHLLGCTIVALRRRPGDPAALALFDDITTGHGAVVAATMNLRWLTSVCDTFCDVGVGAQRATGLVGTMMANMVKLVETERRLFMPQRPWPPKTRMNNGGALFDGVITFWIANGDMIDNLLGRAEAVLADGNAASPFVTEILLRLARHDTVLRRMMSINDGRELPVAPEAARQAAKRAMRDL